MTPKQTSLYWREWAAVRRVEKAADRHALHVRALGREVSSKVFTNAQFDAVLGVFRAVSKPSDLGAQIRQQEQERTRHFHLIDEQMRCVALYRDPDGYLARVIKDKFRGAKSLDDLSEKPRIRCRPGTTDLQEGDSDLMMLRFTLAARLNEMRNAAGDTLHDMKTKAGVPCHCTACRTGKKPAAKVQEFAPLSDVDESGAEGVAIAGEGDPF